MSASQFRLPNVFLAGAPKAGTTSLYHALAQHPDIYMSRMKEPSFFAPELRPENHVQEFRQRVQAQNENVRACIDAAQIPDNLSGVVTDWDTYLKLFAPAAGQAVIGEASVCYLWSASAPRLIAERIPAARIVLVLRDPAERAFSQYRSYTAGERFPQTFREHIDDCQSRGPLLRAANPLLQFGRYAEQLERYLQWFPRRQIGIWIYEDTLRNPALFMQQLFEFLGVDPSFKPVVKHRHKEVRIPRYPSSLHPLKKFAHWAGLPAGLREQAARHLYKPQTAMRINPQDRRFLVDYYRDDIEQLTKLLNRDLSAWLRT